VSNNLEIKIIDAFTFFNDVNLLKMRLEFHDPYVDKFYICESNITYSGLPKDYIFERRRHEFAAWEDKIHYIKYSPDISGLDFSKRDKEQNLHFDSPAWILEFGQRDELKKHIHDVRDDDIVIITDMDEFIDPKVFKSVKQYSQSQSWVEARLNMPFFVYYMNCIWPGKLWTHPYLVKGKRFKEIESLSRHRHSAGMWCWFTDAGWHFSSVGGLDAVMQKLRATSHTEYMEAGVVEESYIQECMKFCMNPTLDRKEPRLQSSEFGFLPLNVFPPELRKIMLNNPQFIMTNLRGD
jgi:beta-1,4-mannosyl-glycoprotein beta-1,4-N-acetylglucosaminyltransferase